MQIRKLEMKDGKGGKRVLIVKAWAALPWRSELDAMDDSIKVAKELGVMAVSILPQQVAVGRMDGLLCTCVVSARCVLDSCVMAE